MKVNQLVASIQRLHMVKSRSKYKASINHKDEELKIQWLNLSKEADELLEIYNNADFSNGKLIVELFNKEWQLYLKMKVLTNKNNVTYNYDETLKKIEEMELIDNEQ